MWQKTWAGNEQAFLAGERYVLSAGKGGAVGQVYVSAFDGDLGFFPDRDAAINACEQHAGTNSYDPIPAHWDCGGEEPGRYVG